MKLNKDERIWLIGREFVILKPQEEPPKTLDEFLLKQEEIIQRLVEDLDEADVQEQERNLRETLPENVRIGLPMTGLLTTFKGRVKMLNLLRWADAGTAPRDWILSIREMLADLNKEVESEAYAKEYVEELDLAQYLERVLY